MLDLTFHSSGNPVRLQEISTRQSISLHYLEQLFRKLRTGKVVKSVRGPGGGYVLARSMDEISMKDVLDCVGENINPARDIVAVPSSGIEILKDEAGNDINGVVIAIIPFIGNFLTRKALFLIVPTIIGLWLVMDAMKNAE
jgi:hypothetical protein